MTPLHTHKVMTWLFPAVMSDILQDAITLIFLLGNIISKIVT
ncbi:Hypothetical protein GbCGDNIH6_8293 [Granulibacter bethesdensis]|nr:Hypothetical protein GbCGDNIH6_8293 [Granulibacter bethesdensis]